MKLTNCKYPPQVTLICASIIVTVTEISKQSSPINMAELYTQICAKFDSVIRLCKVNSINNSAALELLYPLAAIIDETILSIPNYRFYWSERLLQLHYFGETVAGATFFSRLSARMKAASPDIYILELYFISMAIGLKGEHLNDASQNRVKIFENLGVMLKNSRDKNITPRLNAIDTPEKRKWKMTPIIVYLAIVSLIMAITAVIYHIECIKLLKIINGGFN